MFWFSLCCYDYWIWFDLICHTINECLLYSLDFYFKYAHMHTQCLCLPLSMCACASILKFARNFFTEKQRKSTDWSAGNIIRFRYRNLPKFLHKKETATITTTTCSAHLQVRNWFSSNSLSWAPFQINSKWRGKKNNKQHRLISIKKTIIKNYAICNHKME